MSTLNDPNIAFYTLHREEFARLLEKWFNDQDSSFTDVIMQKMKQSTESGLLSPLLQTMMTGVRKFVEEDHMSFEQAFGTMFTSMNEIYVNQIVRLIGK